MVRHSHDLHGNCNHLTDRHFKLNYKAELRFKVENQCYLFNYGEHDYYFRHVRFAASSGSAGYNELVCKALHH